MYTYIQSEPGLWTVGFYSPDGKWVAESDHQASEPAAQRVHWLNGGSAVKDDEHTREECSYYTHYLARHHHEIHGERLEHAAFHYAEKKCTEAHAALFKWLDEHPGKEEPPHLVHQCDLWGRKIAAYSERGLAILNKLHKEER